MIPSPQQPRRMLFVLSLGRSGTQFLARLLGGVEGASFRHEHPGDALILSISRYGRSKKVVDALLQDRFDALMPRDPRIAVYGEVNSYLRYNAEWLRQRFDAVLIHVTRDGREFVRSAYERDLFTPQQRQLPIVPTDEDPFAAEWPSMDRFERICWVWKHTNEMLGETVQRHVRLEDLLSDYACFRTALLEPSGLDVTETEWLDAVRRPQNTSSLFRMRRRITALLGRARPGERLPAWREWPEDLAERFWRICGSTMDRFGYER